MLHPYNRNIRNNFRAFIFLILIFLIDSEKCQDENCENCSADGMFCFICKKDLVRYQYRCLKRTKKIKNCILSDTKENFCMKCDYGCKPVKGICVCTLKYILYVIYLLIIVLTVGTFLFCLTHNTLAKYFNVGRNMRFRPFNDIIINNNDINNSVRILNINNNNENNLSQEELVEEFCKNLFIINDVDIENKKCQICKNIICNLLLDCGCFVCFDCEKKALKERHCLCCNKEFQTMKQVSCSICFNNKKELGCFNCQCRMVICKECFIKWRLKHKNCPTCREIII